MKSTKINQKNKINLYDFTGVLNKISFLQLFIPSLISLIYLTKNQNSYFSGILFSALSSFTYTQLIKLGNYSKLFTFLGFPLRLMIVGIPCAILVHKFHSNLIALFIGFALCQIIYFSLIWSYATRRN